MAHLSNFQFMLPVQIIHNNGTMVEVGILDAFMGFGMIVSGIVLSRFFFNKLSFVYKINILLIILSIVFWLFGVFIFKALAVFFLGFCFNINRIIIRSILAQKYEAYIAGSLVSKANSLSFFIIISILFFLYDNVSINWIIPFVFTALITLCIFFEKNHTSI